LYTYIKSSLHDNRDFFEMYIKSLTSRYDDFLEERILGSEIFSVIYDAKHIGYFGVFKSQQQKNARKCWVHHKDKVIEYRVLKELYIARG
jgi:hypothetical protein